MTEFTVATANTYQANMLRDTDGLKPFTDSGTDILLMQEVLGMAGNEIEDCLGKDGFVLAHFDLASGLAIAARAESILSSIKGSQRTDIIHPMPLAAKLALQGSIPVSKRLRERSIISTQFETTPNQTLTVATSHPIVFMRAIARAKQIQRISKILKEDSFTGPLIMGADMNHYPSPRKVDTAMHAHVGLTAVEIDEPTWKIAGSKHQWAARVGSIILRRPLDSFDAQLDALLYRHLSLLSSTVVDIASDHRAIIARMSLD